MLSWAFRISSLFVLYPAYLGKIALLSPPCPPPTPAISSKLSHFFHPKQKGSHLSPFSQLPLWFLSPTLLQLFVSLNSQTLPYFLIFLLHLNRGVCVCVCVCVKILIKLTILTTSQCKVQWHCRWGKICSHTPDPTGVKSPGPVVLGGGLFPQGSLGTWLYGPAVLFCLSLYLPAWVLLWVSCPYQLAPSFPSC